MLVINGHWQDAACWEKGRRRINGWSQIIPRVWPRGRTPTLEPVTAGPFPGRSQGSVQSLGHAFFGVRVSPSAKEDRKA